jgi:hypothetical protein
MNWKKYAWTLMITIVIFITAIALSNYFSNKKITSLREIEDKISTDIMSSETQYSLLAESACKDLSDDVLSRELNTFAQKLTYTEENLSQNSSDLLRLKTYYTLLQIKDYLLMKKICNPFSNLQISHCLVLPRYKIIKSLVEFDFLPKWQNRHGVSCLELARAKLIIEQHDFGINSNKYNQRKILICLI